MARPVAFVAAALGMMVLIQAALPVQAGGTKSDTKVKVTATAAKPDSSGKQTITITLAHEKGWHTYANPVGNDDLDSGKTVVTILAKGKPLPAKVTYPMGKLTKDKVVGDYSVYENKTNIKAIVQRASGDASPLEVSVRIQACDEKACLLPATVKVALP